MLVRCVYASRAIEPIAKSALTAILESSRRNNGVNGITGLLCHSNGVFVQVLEGGRANVSSVLGRIFGDKRHRDIQVLVFEEIGARHFGNWSMGAVNLASVNPALLLRYSEKAVLDPFASGGAATVALLMELAASGAIGVKEA
jgi:hypothetical protein